MIEFANPWIWSTGVHGLEDSPQNISGEGHSGGSGSSAECSGAKSLGVKLGDVLVSINGAHVRDLTFAEVCGRLKEAEFPRVLKFARCSSPVA